MKFDALFFSPHLDDAILSSGGEIAGLIQNKKNVKVITFFTGTHDNVVSHFGHEFLTNSGFDKIEEMFTLRKIEDQKALKSLKSSYLHFSFIDGCFRLKNTFLGPKPIYPNEKSLFSGFMHDHDKWLLQEIKKECVIIKHSLAHTKTAIYCPLGIGGHVDHLIIFEAVVSIFSQNIYFWEDTPYRTDPLKKYSRLASLQSRYPIISAIKKNILPFSKIKKRAIQFYVSQLSALNKSGLCSFDYANETFYSISMN